MLASFGPLAFAVLAGLALAGGTIGAAAVDRPAAQAASKRAAEPLACEVRMRDRAGTRTIEPVVRASGPVAGDYRLRVVGRSGAGRSDLGQGGPFVAGAGETALGAVTLVASGRVDATLEILSADGAVACAAEARR